MRATFVEVPLRVADGDLFLRGAIKVWRADRRAHDKEPVIWKCSHRHVTRTAARACAERKLAEI